VPIRAARLFGLFEKRSPLISIFIIIGSIEHLSPEDGSKDDAAFNANEHRLLSGQAQCLGLGVRLGVRSCN